MKLHCIANIICLIWLIEDTHDQLALMKRSETRDLNAFLNRLKGT